ncbi:glutamyl-tRNA reductase [compost metagenome]
MGKHASQFSPEQLELLEQLTQGLTNKLLHGPVSQLRDMSSMQQQQHAHTLVELFGLQVEDAAERYQRRLRERRGATA